MGRVRGIERAGGRGYPAEFMLGRHVVIVRRRRVRGIGRPRRGPLPGRAADAVGGRKREYRVAPAGQYAGH
jgi:hypothetical protein